MRRVILEVPFIGDTKADRNANLCYLNACVADSLERGEAPIALAPMIVGAVPSEEAERRAIELADEWRGAADSTVVYTDRGLTLRAQQTKDFYESGGNSGRPSFLPSFFEYRTVPNWESKFHALPIFLGPGDAALTWEVDGHPHGQERVLGQHFRRKGVPVPVLFDALFFALGYGDKDPRLAREIVRFMERIDRIAAETRRRLEAATKANRS